MKKTLMLLAAFCLIASVASAQAPQLAKGNIMAGVTSTLSVGGSQDSQVFGLAFGTEKWAYGSDDPEAEYKFTVYNFLPRGGYFIIDNLVAGLEIILSGSSEKDVEDDDTWKESTLGIGPFVRYYYPLEKFYPFAEVEAMFGRCKVVEDYGDAGEDEYKEAMTVFGIYLGAALPLGDKITIDASAGYMRASYKWDADGELEGGTDIVSGFGLKIGFSIYLPL
jgi:hypothetical protein